MENNTSQLQLEAIYLPLLCLRTSSVTAKTQYALWIAAILLFGHSLHAQQPCVVTQPTTSFTIRHVAGRPDLTLDRQADIWKRAAAQSMSTDCSRQMDYPNITTEIRAFWTDTDLYILFSCPYTVLNLFLPADNSEKHVGLCG